MENIQFNFGDTRLNDRGSFCFNKISFEPALSFPTIFKKSKELEGFYRFINNPRVHLIDLEESIFSQTKSNLNETREALAIHDTTVVIPSSKDNIEAFQKARGFLAHLSLLVSSDSEKKKQIFGAIDLHMWNRSEKTKPYASEADRWFDQARKVEDEAPGVSLIHVMDREGDMCGVWSHMVEQRFRFVIRSKFNRKVKSPDPDLNLRLHQEMQACPTRLQIEVDLEKKKGSKLPRSRKSHPPREKRKTVLNITAKQVAVHKTNKAGFPIDETITMNVVRVFEDKPPSGAEPVEWFLLTTEAIENEADILRVVDIYKSRWIIEEFFKGIKTGCQLESRLLEDPDSWYKLFAFYLPIARDILNLRLSENEDIHFSPAFKLLTPTQVEILKIQAQEHNLKIRTHKDSLIVIAKLGGYIIRKTPPGWITLLRGYQYLLKLEEGWLLAHRNK